MGDRNISLLLTLEELKILHHSIEKDSRLVWSGLQPAYKELAQRLKNRIDHEGSS